MREGNRGLVMLAQLSACATHSLARSEADRHDPFLPRLMSDAGCHGDVRCANAALHRERRIAVKRALSRVMPLLASAIGQRQPRECHTRGGTLCCKAAAMRPAVRQML